MGKAVEGDFSGMSLKNAAGGPTAEGGTNPIQAEAATATDVTSQPFGKPLQTTDVTGQASQVSLIPENTTEALYSTAPDLAPASVPGADPLATLQDKVGNLGQSLQAPAPAPAPSASQALTLADQTALEAAGQAPSFLESGQSLVQDPSLANLKELAVGRTRTTAEIIANSGITNPATGAPYTAAQAAQLPVTDPLVQAASSAAQDPSIVRSLAIPVGATTIGGGIALDKLMGGDKPQDEPQTVEDLERQMGPTSEELMEASPGDYLVAGGNETPQYSSGQYVIDTAYAYDPTRYYNRTPFLRAQGLEGTPFVQAAAGGEIFPRRVGGIMPDEGTPGKDSVRAMLMPGEFVMTTNAVKGLGNGNNQVGINRMYDLMRGLEAKGKAMA